MKENNYYCSEPGCTYRTNVESPKAADEQLINDGGLDVNKKSMCPECKNDSLVFIHS